MQHLTLDIDDITLNRTPADYHYWSMPTYQSAVLDDPRKKYYLYIKANGTAPKGTAGSAEFLLSETAYSMNQGRFYYFLVGILNSESDGERSFVTLYGFTEVLPGRITTDRIVSADGNTYFDLANGEIGGRILFHQSLCKLWISLNRKAAGLHICIIKIIKETLLWNRSEKLINESTSIPKTSASLGSTVTSGQPSPRSHLETALSLTLHFSASSF